MNRRLLVLGAAALLLIGAIFWIRHDGDSSGGKASTAAKAAEANDVTVPARMRERVSPASLAPVTIEGSVTSKDGKPVPGAQVCATPWSKDLAQEDTRIPRCTKANEAGVYKLEGLLPASYAPFASAKGFKPGRYKSKEANEEDWIKLAAGEQADEIDIALSPGGVEVSGTVLDIGGGPIAGAAVTGWGGRNWQRDSAAFAMADDEGHFTLWLPKGRVSFSASAEGYSAGEATGAAPGDSLEILLTPEGVLSGRVVEAGSGEPIARAKVTAMPVAEGYAFGFGGMGQGGGSAFTDEGGNYRITRLPPSRYKAKASIPGGYGESTASVLLGLGQTVEDVVIEVGPAFVVSGRIVVGQGDEPCTKKGWVSLSRGGDMRNGDWAQVEEDGTAEFNAVLPGEYEVSVNCKGALSQQTYEAVVVVADDVEDLIWRVGAGANIAGTVRSASGEPVDGATVQLQGLVGEDARAQLSSAWEQTQDDGSYEAQGIAPGRAKITVMSESHPGAKEPIEVELVSGETTTTDITLQEGGSILGTIVSASQEPVGGAEIRSKNVTKPYSWSMFGGAHSNKDGSFEITGLEPGSYRVSADGLRAPGSSDDDVDGTIVEVTAGSVSNVSLVVESQNESITGQVKGADGAPITDAYVSAVRESDAAGAAQGGGRQRVRWNWGQNKPVMTDLDGNFELKDLAGGKYTIRAYRKGGGETLAESIETGSTVSMSIAETGSISGEVSATSAEAPIVFSISVSDKESGYSRSERFVGTKGKFEMRDLPAGDYTCSMKSTEGTASTTVTLEAGQTREGVKLELSGLATITGRVVDLETGEPVKGLRTMARLSSDMRGMGMSMNGDNKNITDDDGRFTIEKAPTGKLAITAFAVDWENSPYQWLNVPAFVEPGKEVDLGDLKIAKKRLGKDDQPGDLGFTYKQMAPGTEMEDWKVEIALIHPGGPAAESGLKVDDRITSVDGQDITENASLYWTLANVPEGRTVTFGLERGETIEITAGPPRAGATP